jgi:hypothetical protein
MDKRNVGIITVLIVIQNFWIIFNMWREIIVNPYSWIVNSLLIFCQIQCRLMKVLCCLVSTLWISEFPLNWFLFLITKSIRENIYWDTRVLLLLQWAGHFCRMHCSLMLIVLPLYNFQHSLNNPALRIKEHRSLIETVLMSLVLYLFSQRPRISVGPTPRIDRQCVALSQSPFRSICILDLRWTGQY